MNKKDLKNYFNYSWSKYLLSLVIIVLFWSWLTNILIRPNFNERINMFIAVNELIISEVDEFKDDFGLKEINIIYQNPKEEMFNMILTSTGLVDTDILILDIKTFHNANVLQWFKEIDLEVSASYLENIDDLSSNDFFYYEGKIYGIKLFEDIYIFLNRDSRNLGPMNDNGKITDDKALRMIKLIIDEVNLDV